MSEPLIHAAMAKCLGEIGAVGKLGENRDQHYKFRALADVYHACQPVMARNGVHFAPFAIRDYQCEKFDRGGGKYMWHVTMLVEHRFYASDGSFVPAVTVGEAMDFSDKASNKAMSAAAKYALVQGFCLPETDPKSDGDNESPEVDAFAPLWARLEESGLSDPSAVKSWCETQLGRPLPSAESLKIADLPRLLEAAAKYAQPNQRPQSAPASQPDTKELALRLAAELGRILPAGAGSTKKEISDSHKASMLAWVNGFRPNGSLIKGFGELTAAELIELTAQAKAGEMPSPEDMPEWTNETK